ncbi:MAG: ABC transporter ATP-binding protein [Actinobacteria bacterium]|nr:ABC transporter ATP-binding protein [Actinomycetota bacterium]
MTNLMSIHGLSKHYRGFDLCDVDLCIPAGSVVGFIGSNGSGKTTTIKAALGLIFPDSGDVELFGSSIYGSSDSTESKQRVGVVFDACAFPGEVTIKRAAAIMEHAYDNWDTAVFHDYLQKFNLPSNKLVKDISRGMSMKLMLACALSHKPDLLILDEATAGLDPLAREEILDILREFMKDENHGIFISSHITSDLEKIADYIVCIDEGRIVFSIEKDAITDMAGVAKCRAAEFEMVTQSDFFEIDGMHYMEHEYEIDVLVKNRFAFAEAFKDIALDKAGIDEYMALVLKGEVR